MNERLQPPVSGLVPLRRRRWLLILPPLVEFAVDIGLTLAGQPAEYWTGDSAALEVNPVGFYFLSLGAIAFVVGAVLYAVLFSLAIIWLPELLAFWISLGLLIAHASGSNTWLTYQYGSWTEGTHNTLAAVVAAVCYRGYFLRRARDAEKS